MASESRSCICCHQRSTELVRWGFKNFCHLECGIEKWGQAFLNHLTVEQLKAIPESLLREKHLFDSWQSLLKRKQEYMTRSDLIAGQHPVRAI